MATRAQQIKVGIFLLVSAVVIVAAILIMQGINAEPTALYSVRFRESVLGLSVGSLVEYVGVPVGEVKNIRVAPDNSARVEIEVSTNKVTIREGVRARLVMVSFATGQMAISLKGGEERGEPLKSGSQIPASHSAMESFSASAETVLQDVGVIVGRLNSATEGIEPGQFARMLEQVEMLLIDSRDFMASARNVMHTVEENADGTMHEYTELAKDLRELSDKLSGVADSADKFLKVATEKVEPLDLEQSQQDLNVALQNFSEMSEELKQAVSSIDDVTNALLYETDNMEHSLREGVESMTDAFKAVEELADTLNEDPSALVRGRGTPRNQ